MKQGKLNLRIRFTRTVTSLTATGFTTKVSIQIGCYRPQDSPTFERRITSRTILTL